MVGVGFGFSVTLYPGEVPVHPLASVTVTVIVLSAAVTVVACVLAPFDQT